MRLRSLVFFFYKVVSKSILTIPRVEERPKLDTQLDSPWRRARAIPSVLYHQRYARVLLLSLSFFFASFIASLGLFLYLSYKVIAWRLGKWLPRRRHKSAPGHVFTSGPVRFGPAYNAARLAGSEPMVDAILLAPSERTESSCYQN